MTTPRCLRCNGLMVSEDWQGGERDPQETGLPCYRCLSCGFIVDEVIARNKGLYSTPAPTLTVIPQREDEQT
jgi:hypothetical protein